MNPIIAHLIGDYLLQTDWMAKQKKITSWACIIHVLSYMVPFLFCGLPAWALFAIGAQHFAQDRWGFVVWLMNKKGSADFAKPPMAPWSIIVTDNVLHVVFISAVVALNGTPPPCAGY